MKKLLIAMAAVVAAGTVSAQEEMANNSVHTGAMVLLGNSANFVKENVNFTSSDQVYLSVNQTATTFGVKGGSGAGTGRAFGAGSDGSLTRCTTDTRALDGDGNVIVGDNASGSDSEPETIEIDNNGVVSFENDPVAGVGC